MTEYLFWLLATYDLDLSAERRDRACMAMIEAASPTAVQAEACNLAIRERMAAGNVALGGRPW